VVGWAGFRLEAGDNPFGGVVDSSRFWNRLDLLNMASPCIRSLVGHFPSLRRYCKRHAKRKNSPEIMTLARIEALARTGGVVR
jgi:hypothetical protein